MKTKKIPWYTGIIVAVIVFIVGCVYTILNLLSPFLDSYPYVLVPGEKDIELLEAGEYTVFYEYDSNQQKYNHVIDKIQISIVDVETQSDLLLTRYQNAFYSLNNFEGESMYKFTINESGEFRVVTDTEILPHDEIKLTFVQDFLGEFTTIFISFSLTLFLTLVFIIISIYMKWKEGKK
ncbi:hypothetical protein [Chengkuizengella axinellae]|uniref:DUF3592 domain-containing protein n=1 Tax=Chengkuizengella axinellae TaxID=3064388 RepID=A0ABT9IU12_9BACL|nr:hypothetical protein [Chengkuizengella sp. 2205SS18-9]MDP5272844.1 hypothetical protein [Chengkuizengella sp. 2205SS18-9]